METFSALLAICAGNSPVTGEFPAQRPVRGNAPFACTILPEYNIIEVGLSKNKSGSKA